MPGALFVNIPARGHIHPTLPVVADLVALGERVTYCLPAEDEALIRPTGAAFRAVGNALPEARDRRGGSTSLAELPALAIRGATRTLPELLAVATEVEPDYVVFDGYAAAGRFLARLLGLPAVATYATYAFNLTSLRSGEFGGLAERATVQTGLPGFDEAVAELVARFDLAPPTLGRPQRSRPGAGQRAGAAVGAAARDARPRRRLRQPRRHELDHGGARPRGAPRGGAPSGRATRHRRPGGGAGPRPAARPRRVDPGRRCGRPSPRSSPTTA